MDVHTDTQDSNSGLHARNTDPITSKLSALEAESNRAFNESKVLEILGTTQGMTSREIAETLEIDYVTISPLMRPMARRGLVHECGTRCNPGTGHKAILWAVGPSQQWVAGRSMDATETGPHETLRWFTEPEILALVTRAKVANGGWRLFVSLLNGEIAERFVDA
jgi:hypothetical protein